MTRIPDMLLLAVETATEQGSVALWEEGYVVGELSLALPGAYLRHLLPAVDTLLTEAGRHLSQVRAVAVSQGPGNFTGLRIGMATVQALAFALQVPGVPVSTLEVIAARLPLRSEPVGVLVDAKRGEVYFGLFRCEGVTPLPLGEAERLPVRQLAARLHPPMVLTGPGLTVCEEVLKPLLPSGVAFAPPELRFPQAATLARLAWQRLSRGAGVSPAALFPTYLRPAL
ncbi:MAG: tRNA (adenosine(37)-N6)-threonylcarbamoyltransferase complex dimerization subunit type 1 TsaB [Syntrophobacterales bacterium]|nr:tRNA (adenosine(37)-N6)-threonylcarbamoyltransferase complex dimerization subunit type 1 TsaB [Syntrophobacterales bacterium]